MLLIKGSFYLPYFILIFFKFYLIKCFYCFYSSIRRGSHIHIDLCFFFISIFKVHTWEEQKKRVLTPFYLKKGCFLMLNWLGDCICVESLLYAEENPYQSLDPHHSIFARTYSQAVFLRQPLSELYICSTPFKNLQSTPFRCSI